MIRHWKYWIWDHVMNVGKVQDFHRTVSLMELARIDEDEARGYAEVTTKQCVKCQWPGPFAKASLSKDGLDYYCKPCRHAATVKWRNQRAQERRCIGCGAETATKLHCRTCATAYSAQTIKNRKRRKR